MRTLASRVGLHSEANGAGGSTSEGKRAPGATRVCERRGVEEFGLGVSFRVGAGLEAGLTEGRLRGPSFVAPHFGVRVPAGVELPPQLRYAPLLRPGDRFSHTSAAEWYGAPLPAGERPVHVTNGAGLIHPRRPGVVGHRDARDAVDWLGLPVSAPDETFIECASLLGPAALVAIGDYLVLSPRIPEPGRPFASIDALRAAAAPPRRGAKRARAAVELVRGGVESPRETRLRLLLVGAGLPEPVCGYPLHDDDGDVVGWFDLAWPERRVLGEYDGDQHRTSTEQCERDIRRFDRAADLAWRVIRVRKHGLAAGAAETIARFRRALA